MKIYSWNMLYRNSTLDRAFAFIRDTDFDVFCLQEVPLTFLEQLKELPLTIASCIDARRVTGEEDIYNLILSKYPLSMQGEIAFPDYPRALRTRAFIRLMKPFHFTTVTGRHGVYADIRFPEAREPVRVFSVHTILGTPALRRGELESVFQKVEKSQHTIVCGDFNILESFKVTLLNWLLGGRFVEIFSTSAERAGAERLFAANGFKNPLRGRISHTFSRSQLDHILVPAGARVSGPEVIARAYGSDHNPVLVEVAL